MIFVQVMDGQLLYLWPWRKLMKAFLARENKLDNNKLVFGRKHFFGSEIQLMLILLLLLICVLFGFPISSTL